MNIKDYIIKERQNVIKQIITLYPKLKNDYYKILEKLDENDKNKCKNRVFTKRFINGENYYIDIYRYAYDNHANLLGIYNEEHIIFFDEMNNKIDLIKNDIIAVHNLLTNI